MSFICLYLALYGYVLFIMFVVFILVMPRMFFGLIGTHIIYVLITQHIAASTIVMIIFHTSLGCPYLLMCISCNELNKLIVNGWHMMSLVTPINFPRLQLVCVILWGVIVKNYERLL